MVKHYLCKMYVSIVRGCYHLLNPFTGWSHIGNYKESIYILHSESAYLCKIYIKYCKFMK